MREWKPKHIVQSIRWLDPTTFVLRIDRHDLAFRAGQCISLGVFGSGVNREYSVYSGEDAPYLELLVLLVQEGTVSPALARLQSGDPVYVAGPYSDFVLPKQIEPAQKLVFVATGTGIAPFHSFVVTRPDLDYTILHGVRSRDQRYEHEQYPANRYVACVSRERCDLFHGRVTDYFRERPVASESQVYLCGNHKMIEDAFDLLRNQGVRPDNIHSEVFF